MLKIFFVTVSLREKRQENTRKHKKTQETGTGMTTYNQLRFFMVRCGFAAPCPAETLAAALVTIESCDFCETSLPTALFEIAREGFLYKEERGYGGQDSDCGGDERKGMRTWASPLALPRG